MNRHSRNRVTTFRTHIILASKRKCEPNEKNLLTHGIHTDCIWNCGVARTCQDSGDDRYSGVTGPGESVAPQHRTHLSCIWMADTETRRFQNIECV